MQEMQETHVSSLGGEDLLEEEMATHSSILVWEIPWTEEPGGLQSKGSQRIRHVCTHAHQLHAEIMKLHKIMINKETLSSILMCLLHFWKLGNVTDSSLNC